jgi:polysaccharide export outer membrane protein
MTMGQRHENERGLMARLCYRHWPTAAGVLGVTLLLGACTSEPKGELIDLTQAKELTDYHYLVGPGDTVNIFVWGLPSVSGSVPVRPDGRISMPLIDELFASGKTAKELTAEVEKELAKYIKDPFVTVMPGGFVGRYDQQVRVIGEASEPLAIPYRQDMTLLDLLIAAGGLTEFAAGNKAVIIRYKDGKPYTGRVRIDDLIQDGDITANVAMRPGDVLIIPEAWF